MPIASYADPKGLKNPKPIAEWIHHFLPLLRPFWKELCLAGLAMVLDGTLSVFRPWPLKVVIDRVLSHKPSRVPFHALRVWLDNAPYSKMQILYGACAASLLIALLTGLLTYYFTRLLGKVGQRYVFALRRDLFAHIQRLSLRFHDRQRTGDLTHRVTSDIQSIQDFIVNGSIVFGSNGFLLIAMLVMMFSIDWRFALASLSIAPPLFWTVFRHTRRIKLATRRARHRTSLMGAPA